MSGIISAGMLAVVLVACPLTNIACSDKTVSVSTGTATPETIPEDLKKELDRFTFINTATGDSLKEFRILGFTQGSYESVGVIFDTYVVAFEDRYDGAAADHDFLDVIVEMKRARDSGSTTVRIVQLGLDTIDVYLDGEFLESIRPALEIQIHSTYE